MVEPRIHIRHGEGSNRGNGERRGGGDQPSGGNFALNAPFKFQPSGKIGAKICWALEIIVEDTI